MENKLGNKNISSGKLKNHNLSQRKLNSKKFSQGRKSLQSHKIIKNGRIGIQIGSKEG